MNNELYRYDTKFVAFVDILGFRDKTNKGNSEKENIHHTLSFIHDFIDAQNCSKNFFEESAGEYYYVFSDSMLFSFEHQSFTKCINTISYLQFACATRGFFLRGGITYDKIFDRNRFFYGKGLNIAYELESKGAHYPRVILDPSLTINNGILSVSKKNKVEKIDLQNQFKQDSDGCLYIDFLSNNKPVSLLDIKFDGIDYSINNYNNIEKHISDGLSMAKELHNTNLIIKYQWLSNYYEAYKKHSDIAILY